MRVLLTGMSGAGKSSVAHALPSQGCSVLDVDDGWSELSPDDGRWHWRVAAVEKRLALAGLDPVFVAGCSGEQALFDGDLRVLLTAPPDVLLARIGARHGNDYGRLARERAQVLADIAAVEPPPRATAHTVVDTTKPLAEVVRTVVAAVQGWSGNRLLRPPQQHLSARAADGCLGRDAQPPLTAVCVALVGAPAPALRAWAGVPPGDSRPDLPAPTCDPRHPAREVRAQETRPTRRNGWATPSPPSWRTRMSARLTTRRVPARLALLGSAAMVAGLLAVPSSAAAAPVVTDGCVESVPETDVLEAGPTSICFTIFKPASASPKNRVPMVLHSHGWGGSRTKTAESFQSYMDAGFGVLSIDQRGHGESGGKAHVEDPAFEGEDMIRVIDHVAKLDWVEKDKPGDPRIGAIGGSYGGGYQFVAAFAEVAKTGKTRLDALAPEITWYSLNESLAPNDVVRSAWVSALYSLGAQQHTSTVHAGYAEGLVTGNWPATMEDFFVDNGPKSHVEAGEKLDIPVLFGQGATDNLFPLTQGLKNYDRALTPKARAKSIFVGYNGGHALPNAVPAGFGTAGDACSRTLAGGAKGVTNFATLAQQFLAENLKGAKPQLTGHGDYHLTTADGACTTVSSVTPNTSVKLAQPVVSTAGAGAPMQVELAKGPLRIAGTPRLDAVVTALGLDGRAFLGLAVGTTAADAMVVQNNVMPHRERSLDLGTARSIEMPSVAVDVPAGKSLFLTVSPVADMFAAHGSRTPGALLFADAVVQLPVVK